MDSLSSLLDQGMSETTLLALKKFIDEHNNSTDDAATDASTDADKGNVAVESSDDVACIETHVVPNKDIGIEAHVAPTNLDYKYREYWEERFLEEDSYEWLLSFQQLIPHLRKEDKILIIGCGNSSLSAELYDAGYENITNIDFSSNVISRMSKMNEAAGRHNMKWVQMDMLAMAFDNAVFDVVIDKAALDSLLVDEVDVWDPIDAVKLQGDVFCSEISRVLSPTGVFLQLSFAQPHFRTKYFMNKWESSSSYSSLLGYCVKYKWNISYLPIESGSVPSFLYILNKS